MITEIRTHVLQAALSQPFAYSRAWYDTRTAMVVEIATDTGLIGWGECYGPARITAAVVDSVAPWLIGADPLRTEYLWREIYARLRDHGQKGVVIEGLSGIDIALWDIKGKHFGVPVHRLLGGPVRSEVQAYATGLYRRKSGDPLKYLAEEAAGYVAEGFKAVKLKVGFGVEEDAAVTRAVREAIGPGVALMVDANHAYDAAAAIRLGRMIERMTSAGSRSRCRPRISPATARSRPRCRFRSPAANASSPASASASSSSRARSTSSSPTPARPAGCPNARRSPTWRRRSASATTRMSGAPASRSPHRCSCWPSCRRTRRRRSRPLEPLLEFDRTEHPIRQALLTQPIEHAAAAWCACPTDRGSGSRSTAPRWRGSSAVG